MSEGILSKLNRLFSLSRDAVLALRGREILYANPAARDLLGEDLDKGLPEDFLPRPYLSGDEDTGDFISSVTVSGREYTASFVSMDGISLLTVPHAGQPSLKAEDPVLLSLRECIFHLRMTLDLAFTSGESGNPDPACASLLYHDQHTLLRLSNMLSDTAALEDGRFRCRLQTADLGQLCRELLDSVQSLMGPRPVLEFLAEPGVYAAALDRERIEQLLLQLLCSALLRSGPEGRIRVELRRKLRQLILTVEDNGAPVPSEQLSCLFSPPLSGQAARLSTGGRVLNLYVAQGIARAHGGTLLLRSGEHSTAVQLALPEAGGQLLRETGVEYRTMTPLLTELSPVLDSSVYGKNYRD